jgi:signal transduction histidine kinase
LSSGDTAEVQPGRLLTWSRGLFGAPGRASALAVLALLAVVRTLDPAMTQSLRLRGFDFEEQLAPRSYQPLPVSIVVIDDKSLAQYGQWPWSRARLAQLVDKIGAGKPRVLGVDIIFAEPDRLSPGRLVDSDPEIPAKVAHELSQLPTHEFALANALRKVPTVLAVGVSDETTRAEATLSRVTMILESGADPRPFLFTHPKLVRSLPEIAAAERGQGSIDSEPDRDGITRRVPLFIFAQGQLVPNFALEMLRVASGAGTLGIFTGKKGVQGAALGGLFVPTDRHGRAYPYFTPSYEARYISAADLLNGSYDPARLMGGAVLLGSSVLGLTDENQTPLGLMPGVEVWAQFLESILTGNLLRRPAFLNFIEIAIVLVAGLVVVFALPYATPRVASPVFLVIVALPLGSAVASFKFSKLLLDGVYPALSSTIVFGVMLSENLRVAQAGRRRLATALQHEHERLLVEEKLAVVGRLSSAIAHEIRNPVAMISGSLAMALRPGQDDSERNQMFAIAAKEAERLEQLTTDFLAYARPRALQAARANVADQLNYVAATARASAREKDVAIKIEADAELEGEFDGFQIRQALLNLVLNAVEACHHSDTVTLRAGTDGNGAIILDVIDPAGPIPPDVTARIFEPFFTTKPAGTGLGLAIARNIARAHHGDLVLKISQPGQVCFSMNIPARTGGDFSGARIHDGQDTDRR